MTEPFVALMRRYCIDYTNSHDLTVCDSIMEPDYTVYIAGMALTRDESYKPAVETVFERFPHLCLAVHELVTNGSRLAMRFSEHAATPDGKLACWAGISMYDWNGTRLTSCRVEQDFVSQQRQLDTGIPDELEPPHVDPWVTTVAQPASQQSEEAARRWLDKGDLRTARDGRIDERPADAHSPIVETNKVEVHDLFSAGDRVAFHASLTGAYIGGLTGFPADGREIRVDVAGLATVRDGVVSHIRAVTDRFGTMMRLMSEAPPA